MAAVPERSKFRNFLLKVSKELNNLELERIKSFYADRISAGEWENITSGVAFLNVLIRKGIIEEHNLDELISNLEDVGRGDLANRCKVHVMLGEENFTLIYFIWGYKTLSDK